MFHILAWRWPFLALFLAAIFYIGRFYTLAGIEHLHLERRDAPAVVADSGQSAPPASQSIWDWDPVQANIPEGFLDNPFHSKTKQPAPTAGEGWSDQLTVGEKLAMWEAQSAAEEGDAPTEIDQSILPISPPIPAPEELLPHASLRSARDSQVAVAPDRFRVSTEEPPPSKPAPSTSPVPSGAMTSVSPPFRTSETASIKIAPEPKTTKHVIRIGSFHVGTLSPSKLAKPHAMGAIVSLIRMYDLVALQGIQSERDDILPVLVDKLNQSGCDYDYLIGPRVGRVSPKVQLAFLFDKEKLETDRYQLYTLDDPQDLLQYEPLVGWFRCKGVRSEEAFTFSLVNLVIDHDFAASERQILPQLVSAIQADGRNEDDWIIAGQISGGVETLPFPPASSVRYAIRDLPTNVSGTDQLDAIFFSALATTEYTGRSGVYDFLRKHNLTLERALEISSHMPVWAEFRAIEGAVPGRVAPLIAP